MNPAPEPAPGTATHPVLTVNSGTAGAIAAGESFISKLAHFSPQQGVMLLALALTLFVCYLTVDGRAHSSETMAMFIRSMESENERTRAANAGEAEKNRTVNAAEFERNRAIFAAEAKSNRDSFAENTKLTIASHQKLSQELGKLEEIMKMLSESVNAFKKKSNELCEP